MNGIMLRTELYKIYSKKVIWITLVLFLILYLVLKLQFINKPNVKYTLEPMRSELTIAVENQEFHNYVRNADYQCTQAEIRNFIPQSVYDYIEQYQDDEHIYRSLHNSLVVIINNYYERIDNREAFIEELSNDVADSDSSSLSKAKKKLLEAYHKKQVNIDLNLESSANNFIDINHTVIFSGVIMLIIVLGLSGIFSDEYSNGMQATLLTTYNGRKGVYISKLYAAVIYTVNIVLIMELFYIIVTAICYHVPDSTISAASTYGLSLTAYHGTVFGLCFRQVLGNILSGLSLGSIVMAVSSFSKNALIPFFISGLYYGGTALYANSIVFPAYLSSHWSVWGELSLFMLQTQYELITTGHYTNVFGLILPTLAVNVVWNISVMVFCLIICYRVYTRKQVKN